MTFSFLVKNRLSTLLFVSLRSVVVNKQKKNGYKYGKLCNKLKNICRVSCCAHKAMTRWW